MNEHTWLGKKGSNSRSDVILGAERMTYTDGFVEVKPGFLVDPALRLRLHSGGSSGLAPISSLPTIRKFGRIPVTVRMGVCVRAALHGARTESTIDIRRSTTGEGSGWQDGVNPGWRRLFAHLSDDLPRLRVRSHSPHHPRVRRSARVRLRHVSHALAIVSARYG